ncbi:MAG: SpaA isopeptide-forming pilin-related protein [Oscillospiraceae bacterium]|nr:SpaA isopeptide-forming pilin-related protein [Oscillospiraceae bacterium]
MKNFKKWGSLLLAIIMLVGIMPAYATGVAPISGSLVGRSIQFGFNTEPKWTGPQLTVNGIQVGAFRYSAHIDGAEYEAFCVNPDRPGPENAGVPPYVIRGARPDLVHILRFGHPNNARMTQAGTAYYYSSAYAAYITRTALVYAFARPGAVLGGDVESFMRQVVVSLVEGTSAWQEPGNFTPSRWARINGVENATQQGTPNGAGMIVSDVFNITNSHANNPLMFRWQAGTPAGTQILDAYHNLLATYPNLPANNAFQALGFRLAVHETSNVTSAGIEIVGIHDNYAGQAWTSRTTLQENQWQEMVFFIPQMRATARMNYEPILAGEYGQFRILKTNMTGTPLGGAVFEITGNDHRLPMTVTVPASGWTSPLFLIGTTITVTEIVPPAGHIIGANPTQTVTITPGQTEVVTLTFQNPEAPPNGYPPPTTSVRIQKICALGRYNIPGALMRLRGISAHTITTSDGQTLSLNNTGINISQVLTEGATTAVPNGVTSTVTDGVWTLEGLPFGAFVVEEERAPDGYSLLPQHTSFAFWLLPPNVEIDVENNPIFDSEGNLVTIINDFRIIPNPDGSGVNSILLTFENYPFSEIIVYKHCEISNIPLTGAHIRIEGFFVEGNAPVITDRTYVTDQNGRVVFRGLPAGTYTVSEVIPPPGFSLADVNFQSVNVSWGQREGNNARPAPVVRFYNMPNSSLEVLKIDGDSGEPLAGAIFELRDPTSGETWQATSGADGIATFGRGSNGNELLPNHTYILVEIQAPTGFVLLERPQEIVLSPGNDNRITVRNWRNPSLTIVKRDAQNHERLAGATFSVEFENGQTVSGSPFTTNSNGEIILPWTLFEGQTERTLIVTEITPPPNYLLSNPNWQRVTMRQGENNIVTFDNYRRPNLTIRKIDSITGDPIRGAWFTIVRAPNNSFTGETVDLGRFQTNENGEIVLENQDVAWFRITEIEPAPGFQLPEIPTQEIFLAPGENRVVTFENTPLSAIVIRKVDAQTGEPLQGAVFRVRYLSGTSGTGGTVIGEFTSSSNGTVTVTGLQAGTYIIEEIRAPQGFIIDRTPQTVYITGFEQSVVTVEFANRRYGGLLIVKTCEETGRVLQGAQFRVTNSRGGGVGTANGLFTTNAQGEIFIPNLQPDSYIVTEVRAPQGFELNSQPQTIRVNASGEIYRLEFTNRRIPERPTLTIEKVDEDGRPLQGARFEVRRANGELITKVTTDRAGLARVELDPGSFQIIETQAPAGYIIVEPLRVIEIRAGENRVERFVNPKMPSVVIRKICGDTGRRLQGVEFEIARYFGNGRTGQRLKNYAVDNSYTFTTDRSGHIYLPTLEHGVWIAIETRPLPGFAPADPTIFTVGDNGDLTVIIRNYRMPSLTIQKICSVSRAPLQGVRFEISTADGTRLRNLRTGFHEFITDRNGLIFLPEIEDGTFFLRETRALPGYAIDREVIPFSIDSRTRRQDHILTVENTPLAGLRLLKVDGVTGAPIFNVEFMIFDSRNNVVGVFLTDNNGLIDFTGILTPGRYTIRETRPAPGYSRDDVPRTVELVAGRVTEIRWTNYPIAGQLQILKISGDNNQHNGLPAGTPLQGAIFEIFCARTGNFVDRIQSNERGMAISRPLPLGRYRAVEVAAPAFYMINPQPIYFEIEFERQIIRKQFPNFSANTGVSVTKTGVREAMQGHNIVYTFQNVRNDSTIPLDNFFLRDILPTNAIRADRLVTGTFNHALTYRIYATTNLGYEIVVADNLSTLRNNVVNLRPAYLGLAYNEYITEFTMIFGRVPAGFTAVERPRLYADVLSVYQTLLPNGMMFVNAVDLGGRIPGTSEWVITNSTTSTTIFAPQRYLPRSGW